VTAVATVPVERSSYVAEAFDRIVNALLEGRIVPFVGAGISVDAMVPEYPPFRPSIGTGAYLTPHAREHIKNSFREELCLAS
jgi:hypothetical protein